MRALSAAYALACGDPALAEARRSTDCSASQHREVTLATFRLAGFDDELATVLYELDFEPESHRFFDDVPGLLRGLSMRGVLIGVLSNIHFDLRPEFVAAGLDKYVGDYVLSFEHGLQKPDPAIFRLALDRLGVEPAAALVVGDNPVVDGGATAVGIPTLLVPTEPAGRAAAVRMLLAHVG
jgi:HAD superfamily hydrolase (TIGR01509 family)